MKTLIGTPDPPEPQPPTGYWATQNTSTNINPGSWVLSTIGSTDFVTFTT